MNYMRLRKARAHLRENKWYALTRSLHKHKVLMLRARCTTA